MTINEYIDGRIKSSKVKITALCLSVGIDRVTFYRKLRRGGEFTYEEVKALCEAFGDELVIVIGGTDKVLVRAKATAKGEINNRKQKK